jgi:hypothetical protein
VSPRLDSTRLDSIRFDSYAGKVNVSLCLPKYHAIKTRGEMEVQLHLFLTSTLDGDEWSNSHPSHYIPGVRALCTHWIPQSGSEHGSEEQMSNNCPFRKSNPGRPARNLVTILTELPRHFLFSKCLCHFIFSLLSSVSKRRLWCHHVLCPFAVL